MPPLRRGLRFGVFVTPSAADHAQVIEQVQAAERGGLDLIGIQDHPYQRRFLDTFTLIADLAARTQRIRFFPDVANLPLRGPVMIAKAAASLEIMSGGRFDLGLGAGAFWKAVDGMGGPVRRAGESFDALEEAITIIRAALDGDRVVRGAGPHYPVPGFPSGPVPARRVELWDPMPSAPRPLAWTTRSPGPVATRRPCAASTTWGASSPIVRSGMARWRARSTCGSIR
jgi:alkanesulfonate monooxygenase SsuD/methylene tetrahydromethanopterin reductase-like flavin-dependent oxidoreductase (luciferase family)